MGGQESRPFSHRAPLPCPTRGPRVCPPHTTTGPGPSPASPGYSSRAGASDLWLCACPLPKPYSQPGTVGWGQEVEAGSSPVKLFLQGPDPQVVQGAASLLPSQPKPRGPEFHQGRQMWGPMDVWTATPLGRSPREAACPNTGSTCCAWAPLCLWSAHKCLWDMHGYPQCPWHTPRVPTVPTGHLAFSFSAFS